MSALLHISCISLSSSVHVSGTAGHRSMKTSLANSAMLHKCSLASHGSQHAGIYFSLMKRSHCLGRLGAKGSGVNAFNPFVAQRCVLLRQGFFSSVCWAVTGETHLSTTVLQCWKDWVVGVPEKLTKQCHYWYVAFCYFSLFRTSSLSQGFQSSCHLFKLIHCFYL